jgi:hypothetical protein
VIVTTNPVAVSASTETVMPCAGSLKVIPTVHALSEVLASPSSGRLTSNAGIGRLVSTS